MNQIIKYIIAAVLCLIVFKLITLPGIIGTIDTTGTAPTWLTIVAAVVALLLFGWCVFRISKNG